MQTNEIHSTLALNSLAGLGSVRFQALIRGFGSAHEALSAGPKGWIEIEHFDPDLIERFERDLPDAITQANQDLAQLEHEQIRLLLWQSEGYPKLLREIHSPPPVLYVKGLSFESESIAVAVVGSRRCSYYGEKMARRLSAGLAEAGVVTVSGLARGIDSHVHDATVQAKGKTWAVIGSGLGALYPRENEALARRIMENGAVISEFPLMERPCPANFPRRNRIIAGLSRGTVVIEGSDQSGSLITARLAAEEGREVYAVPGPATSPLSVAPHRLLRDGAKLTETAFDVLEDLLPTRINSRDPDEHGKYSDLPPDYRKLLLLVEEAVPKETVASRMEMDPGGFSALLLEMELLRLIRVLPGGLIVRN